MSCLLGSSHPQSHGKLELSNRDFLLGRRHVVLYQIAASAYIPLSGANVQLQEPPTVAFWQTGRREAGTALCFAWHCAALYKGCTVPPSCYCCRLLLSYCRRHLAARASVHNQALSLILLHCVWISSQGKKLI